MFPAIEVTERLEILTRTWKLCERQFDDDVMRGAVAGTEALTLQQLKMACIWVTKNDPKGPLLRGILNAVDGATRAAQRRSDSDKGAMVVPFIKGATEEQVRFYRKPAGYQWDTYELATIYGDLSLPMPECLKRDIEREAAPDLDPAVYGPPPDPTSQAVPDKARCDQLMRQLTAKLNRIGKKMAR